MATSSIFSNIIIRSDDSALAIAKAFEKLWNEPAPAMPAIDIQKASDPSTIGRVLSKLRKTE